MVVAVAAEAPGSGDAPGLLGLQALAVLVVRSGCPRDSRRVLVTSGDEEAGRQGPWAVLVKGSSV